MYLYARNIYANILTFIETYIIVISLFINFVSERSVAYITPSQAKGMFYAPFYKTDYIY